MYAAKNIHVLVSLCVSQTRNKKETSEREKRTEQKSFFINIPTTTSATPSFSKKMRLYKIGFACLDASRFLGQNRFDQPNNTPYLVVAADDDGMEQPHMLARLLSTMRRLRQNNNNHNEATVACPRTYRTLQTTRQP